MSGPSSERPKWIKRLRTNYRLVILNNDTFGEIGSYQLSLLNFYILVSSVLSIGAIIVFLLIFFTPLKQYVPGYGEVTSQQAYVEMYNRVQSLEEALAAQTIYTNSFRKLLVGDSLQVDYDEGFESSQATLNPDVTQVEPIPEDSILRERVEASSRVDNVSRSLASDNIPEGGSSLERLFLIAPVNGEVSAGFQPDIQHFGVDIMAPKNTPVKAILGGIVIISEWSLESGNTIAILHDDNVISIYKHNSQLLKKVGEKVAAGEAVAIIGNTGTMSDGPHLHLELWQNGRPLNPLNFLTI